MKLMNGMGRLRYAVRLFDSCNESFNDAFTEHELLQLSQMFCVCGWDIPPDAWTERQLEEALAGIAPKWDDATERPVYYSPHTEGD